MILVLLHKLNRSPTLHPLDTRRKLNVDKMFRRRPGRLVNLLFTFNLGPVSRGSSSNMLSNRQFALSYESISMRKSLKLLPYFNFM